VIGIDKGQKGVLASSISLLLPKLKGDLDGNLNGGRTVVRCGNACAPFTLSPQRSRHPQILNELRLIRAVSIFFTLSPSLKIIEAFLLRSFDLPRYPFLEMGYLPNGMIWHNQPV
jgi:hypothetical protein